MSTFEISLINFFRKISLPFSRLALFVIFFWFGILKIFSLSPANPLVQNLLTKTLPFISFKNFILFLGLVEIIIGLSFLIPKFNRLAILLMIPHLITTTLPLILLPIITWQSAFAPTLEGQYIIKNLLIVALAINLASHLKNK